MDMFIVRDYKNYFPDLKGKERTDRLIKELSSFDYDGEVVVTRSPSGKPSLQWIGDNKTGIKNPTFVSVSHCGDIFACAFDDAEIGIDIQDERQIDTYKISKRYYTDEELEAVESAVHDLDFYNIWTRKEALAKYTGMGLGQIFSGDSVLDRNDVSFEDLKVLDGIYLSICRSAERAGDEYEIRYIDRK